MFVYETQLSFLYHEIRPLLFDKYFITSCFILRILVFKQLSGDLMGPTVNGLDKLLRMPTGCGEQTMIGFAPDVFITNYLTATNQLTSAIEEKALTYMEKG